MASKTDFQLVTPSPKNGVAPYLVLLGTVAAGLLLLNRARTQQKTLLLPAPIVPEQHLLTRSMEASLPLGASAYPTTSVFPAPTGMLQPAPEVVIEGEIKEIATNKTDWGQWKAIAYEIIETLLLTAAIFVAMRTLVINYRIEGYSMEPNLHEGQHLIVSKASYYFDGPDRGDVIVFEYPYSMPDNEKDYIKRVIGIPGDTVECGPNTITVNGQVIDEPYGPNPWNYTCSPTTLKDNEYFVLGDNRPQSADSHQWGILERKYIIGKALFAYWPLDKIEVVPNYPIQAPDPISPVAQN